MSTTLMIHSPACPECGVAPAVVECQITGNLLSMLRRAGLNGWESLPESAPKAGRAILAVLDAMASNPDQWRLLNPVNGWGSYDDCLQGRLREWAYAALASGPDSTISLS